MQGTAITLTATVTLTSGTPVSPGIVEFCEVQSPPLRCADIRLLATEQLSSAGTASYKFYPGPGTHTYQAIFLGTHLEAASASISAVLTVTSFYPTTTALSASTISSSNGYTLTATVTGSQGSTPPTGTVTFEDASNNNYVLGTAPLVPAGSSTPGGLSFATSQVLDATQYCLAAAVADVNGDGKPDVILGLESYDDYGVYRYTVEVYLGNGDGTFTHMPSIPVTLNTLAFAVGDFNWDGKPDLVVFGVRLGSAVGYTTPGNPPNQVQVLLGNGDGTFTAGQVIANPDPNQPYPALNPPLPNILPPANFANPAIAVGDFNGDGIADIVFTTGVNQTVAVFFGNGDGTFRTGPTTNVVPSPDGIVVADFNGDGKADVAVTNPAVSGTSSSVTILLGNGDGTFTTASTLQNTGNNTAAIVTADFNGDGKPDLATESLGGDPGSGISVFLGNGDGTFTQAPQSPIQGTVQSGSVLAIGDFNGDGKADLVTAAGGPFAGALSVLLGNGDGTLQPPIGALPGSAYPDQTGIWAISAVALGDFVGSGLSGIASANYNDNDATVLLPAVSSQTTALSSTATLSGITIIGSGQHNVIAVYSGSSTYQPSTSPPILVNAAQQTNTVTVTVAPSTALYGQTISMTATISPDVAQDHNATGTVTFVAAGLTLGTANLVNGIASLQSNVLPVGTYNLIAYYSGDTNFSPATGYGAIVINGFNTVTTLLSAPNPSYVGEPVTLTAAVSGVGSSVIPAGSIIFYDNATPIGQGTLNSSGQLAITTSSLSLGTHILTAVYAGSLGYYGSTSAAVTQVVGLSVSATTLTASPNPAGIGQTVTLTATSVVTGNGSSTPPSGTITFFDGTTRLGQATLNSSGQATFSTSTLAAGTHTLTAVYPGIAGYAASTSNAVSEVIESSGFTIALSSPTITLPVYQHTTTTVTLTSLGDFSDNLNIACANLPAYVTCTFTPNPTPLAGNGTATVSFYLNTETLPIGHALPGSNSVAGLRTKLPFSLALLLPLLALAAKPARRRRPSLWLTLLLCASLSGTLLGCGANIITPVPAAAPGTYTIPITATGAATGISHTASLTLQITP